MASCMLAIFLFLVELVAYERLCGVACWFEEARLLPRLLLLLLVWLPWSKLWLCMRVGDRSLGPAFSAMTRDWPFFSDKMSSSQPP